MTAYPPEVNERIRAALTKAGIVDKPLRFIIGEVAGEHFTWATDDLQWFDLMASTPAEIKDGMTVPDGILKWKFKGHPTDDYFELID